MSRPASSPRISLPSRNTLRVAILAVLSAAPVLQAATIPPGTALDASEFLVNSFTANRQDRAKVAQDAAGDFVMVWESRDQVATNSNYDIYAQRYNAAGQPQGSAFLVNTDTSLQQRYPVVAMDAAGDFVIAWESYGEASIASLYDVYARQYNANGTPLQASEFLVNTLTGGDQVNPSVAMDAVGDFVVVWIGPYLTASNIDIFVRQYDHTGSALQTSEFLVNTYTSNTQASPAVAMDAAGDFVVVWNSLDQASSVSVYDIYARQFQANGTPVQSSEFLVNTVTSGNQAFPTVAMDASGDFVVAWHSYGQAASGSAEDIYARQFNAAGTPLQSSEFLVNTITSDHQKFAQVAMDAAGDFVIAWDTSHQSLPTNQFYDIYARRYDAAGTALDASEFRANSFTANHTSNAQGEAAVAMDAAGDFVVTWQSLYQASSTSGYDIYARRYEGPESVDLAATLGASPATVKAGQSFSLTVGVNNNTAATTSYSNSSINDALGAANGISAVFTLPPGVTRGTVSGANWTCGSVLGGSMTCNYATALIATTATPSLTVAFTATAVGSTPFQVDVSSTQQDSNSGDNTANTSVTVNADIAPTANAGSISTTGGTAVIGAVSATPGYTGQALSYSVATQPAHGTVSLTASTGAFTYTPNAGYIGADSFTFTAGDGLITSSAATESITVNDVVPTATSGHFTTNAGAGINGTLVATPGYPGQVLSYDVPVGPTHGSMLVTPSTGAFSYTPNRGFVGSDSFTFTAGDGTVTSSAATVSITVKDVVPMAVSGGAITTAGTAVTKILAANPGYTGQTLSYSIVAQPSHGSVNLTASSGLFTYTPASGFSGADSFKFTVSDGTLTSNSATESITVNAASGGGGGPTGGGPSGGGGGGGGSFGLLSLALLGLPLFGRRRRHER